jgi:hypothetical protein
MKRFSIALTAAFLVTISMTSVAQNSNVRQTSNTNDNQPYKLIYKDIKTGKNDYSKTILNAWKLYDDNRLDDIAMIIADTINAFMPDGSMIKGKDNFLSAMKTYRSGFSSVVSTVAAVTTLKAGNIPEQEVTVIWGTETDIKKDGTTQKMNLHELWFFNKDGMVSQFYQYAMPIMDKK